MKTYRLILIVLISTLSISLSAFGVTPIDSSNWLSHPSIKEIRLIFSEVQKMKLNHELVAKSKKFDYCEPYQDMEREILLDDSEIPRYYSYSAGSDDSAITWQFYYDQSGNLRFAFITAKAVNKTKIEHRIYFNAKGERIWEIQKLIEGPGYTFPRNHWPDADIVKNPIERFNSQNGCPEL
ncbi:MAG: hypothetical protein P8X90_31530 [Desulfobacterales bacterium]|jgi:hypothetical protein